MSQPTWDPDKRRWLIEGEDTPAPRLNRRRSVDVIDRPGIDGRVTAADDRSSASSLAAELTQAGFGGRDPRPGGVGTAGLGGPEHDDRRFPRPGDGRDALPGAGVSDRRWSDRSEHLDGPDPLGGSTRDRTDAPVSYRPGEFDRIWHDGLAGPSDGEALPYDDLPRRGPDGIGGNGDARSADRNGVGRDEPARYRTGWDDVGGGEAAGTTGRRAVPSPVRPVPDGARAFPERRARPAHDRYRADRYDVTDAGHGASTSDATSRLEVTGRRAAPRPGPDRPSVGHRRPEWPPRPAPAYDGGPGDTGRVTDAPVDPRVATSGRLGTAATDGRSGRDGGRYGADDGRSGRDGGRHGADDGRSGHDGGRHGSGGRGRDATVVAGVPRHAPGPDTSVPDGFGPEEFDADGYNLDGLGRDGYGRDGFDLYGFDREGFDHGGFDRDGYDREGYPAEAYDEDEYEAAYAPRHDPGYDEAQWNDPGHDDAPRYDDGDGGYGYGYAAGYGPDGYRPGRRRAHDDEEEPGPEGTLAGGEVPVVEDEIEGRRRRRRRDGTATERRRWPWMVGAAAVAGAVAVPVGMALLGGAGGDGQRDAPLLAGSSGTAGLGTTPAARADAAAGGGAPAQPGGGQVTYEVNGSGKANSITFGRGSAVAQAAGAELPWKQMSPAAEGASDYSLTAVSGDGGGEISCRITIDGAVVAEDSGEGDYAAVSCNGRR